MWPRGLPLPSIGEPGITSFREVNKSVNPLIQQGLIDGDPDVDVLFRLSRKDKSMYCILNEILQTRILHTVIGKKTMHKIIWSISPKNQYFPKTFLCAQTLFESVSFMN